MVSVERNRGYKMMIDFEETELRLGLPGGSVVGNNDDQMMAGKNNNGKRGFVEAENYSNNVDLKLNLSTSNAPEVADQVHVEVAVASADHKLKEKLVASNPAKPPAAKAQVVGWPPVRSFRKNIVAVQKKSTDEQSDNHKGGAKNNVTSAAFVKVSMDGAPYLRKIDLKLYNSYQHLSDALGKMFCSFTIGNCGSQGMKDFMNESKLIDLLNGSDYVATYEDKDGDWMLVGDVPWEMLVESCKRLRIMKGSEAIGLAPRAVEKCKNRS